jgi:hypothetical protein
LPLRQAGDSAHAEQRMPEPGVGAGGR